MPRKRNCRNLRPTRAEERSFVCTYAHHVPGRLRLKVAVPRGDNAVLNAACRELLAIPAVSSACPNFLIGSVVVHYDSLALPPALLCEAIRQLGFLPATASAAPPISLTERVADAAIGKLFEYVAESLVLAAIAAAI